VLVVNCLNGDAQIQKMLLTNIEAIVGPVWQLSGLKSRNLLYFATTGKTTRPALVAAAAGVEDEIPFECSAQAPRSALPHREIVVSRQGGKTGALRYFRNRK
jgi:hypothetical protein